MAIQLPSTPLGGPFGEVAPLTVTSHELNSTTPPQSNEQNQTFITYQSYVRSFSTSISLPSKDPFPLPPTRYHSIVSPSQIEVRKEEEIDPGYLASGETSSEYSSYSSRESSEWIMDASSSAPSRSHSPPVQLDSKESHHGQEGGESWEPRAEPSLREIIEGRKGGKAASDRETGNETEVSFNTMLLRL
ncbi:hypothetical protein T439DRAFT_327947 [Meredithblackwellia eburnea MCA 4105]